ncbi:Endonuclease/exonuclease/phosphatase [Multifurca ochricompacta]|uniref:Endonuclease/exonuclease/phosphatase n=1 Tax=Multifurca ochricompacta TaxID=376703 RepID=A0AAD4M9Q7_9AGAM|nr:Endonuclease/exonuclease/phosphatase [Multifurca ochricompacta]
MAIHHGSRLALEHTFPIHGNFSLEISQLAEPLYVPLDVPPLFKPSTSVPETRFYIKLSEGKNTFAMTTFDMERLSSVALACRRLRDLALKNSADLESHKWLKPYSFHPASWLSVRHPGDLRHICRPVYTRLPLGCAGMPEDDTVDYVLMRDDWLSSKSRSTVRKSSKQQQLRIRTGTFNVNGKLPSQDLSAWLGGGVSYSTVQENERNHLIPSLPGESFLLSLGDTSTPPYVTETGQQDTGHSTSQATVLEPDLLVMAFQEVDLSTEALFYSAKPVREDAWIAAILAALGERAGYYEKLASKQLVGILLIVLVKKDLRSRFSGVRESSVAAGIMGLMGNKGAVAVRLNYRPDRTSDAPSPMPITLTFVNSHLAAFDDQFERRNADFHDISRRLEFGPCVEYSWAPHAEDMGTGPQMVNIYASDVLFWLVDLNYRLNLPDTDIRHLLCLDPVFQGIPTLLQFDQLKGFIHYSKAFSGFEEYPISFLPTYRFNVAEQTDTLGYDTKRKPAWTDRILHMSSPFVTVKQRSYEAHTSITMSDHRPISAEFSVNVNSLGCCTAHGPFINFVDSMH